MKIEESYGYDAYTSDHSFRITRGDLFKHRHIHKSTFKCTIVLLFSILVTYIQDHKVLVTVRNTSCDKILRFHNFNSYYYIV